MVLDGSGLRRDKAAGAPELHRRLLNTRGRRDDAELHESEVDLGLPLVLLAGTEASNSKAGVLVFVERAIELALISAS